MKTIIAKYTRSLMAMLFLAIMVLGPVCAIGSVILSSLNLNLVRAIATVVLLA